MKSVSLFVELLGLHSDPHHALQITDAIQVIYLLLSPLVLPQFPLLFTELDLALQLVVQRGNLVYFLNQYPKFLLIVPGLLFILVLFLMAFRNPALLHLLLQLFVLISQFIDFALHLANDFFVHLALLCYHL